MEPILTPSHSPQDCIALSNELIDSLGGEHIIDAVTARNARAVNQIISRIDPHVSGGVDKLQAIPIALLGR